MIDRQNGDVILSQAMRLGAATSRAEFLESALGRGAQKFIGNGPYCSYRVETKLAGGERFVVISFFHAERMETVWLVSLEVESAGDQEFGSESEQAEHDRKAWHDRWLASVLGPTPPRGFSWGSALSVFEPRSMSSQIVIRYGQADQSC